MCRKTFPGVCMCHHWVQLYPPKITLNSVHILKGRETDKLRKTAPLHCFTPQMPKTSRAELGARSTVPTCMTVSFHLLLLISRKLELGIRARNQTQVLQGRM